MSARTGVNTSSEAGGKPSKTDPSLLAGGVVQMEFHGLLERLNPELFREYKPENFQAGTMAGGGIVEAQMTYRQETLPRGRA